MLGCRSCLFDCLRAIVGDTIPISASRIATATARSTRRRVLGNSARTYATAVARNDDYGFQHEAGLYKKRAFTPYDKPTREATVIRSNLRGQLEEPIPTQQEKELWLELKYLKDPLKLAGHIRHVLRGNDLKKAVGLCRLASKSMECTVSWNHVIDWLMARGDSASAFKTYNEVRAFEFGGLHFSDMPDR